MAVLTITNLDTATYESTFGPVPVGGSRNFQVTTTQLTTALATLNTDSAAGDINYCTSTDPTGMAQGADALNYFGTATINSLVAASQTISGDIVVDDITADDIAADAITGTSVVVTAAVQGATVTATTSSVLKAATADSLAATGAVQGGTLVGTTSTTTANLTATGSIATPPVIVLFAASPYTAAAKPSFLCDATDGAIVFNLPAASALAGRRLWVKKTDAVANNVTVTRAGSDTIDGANTKVLTAQFDFIELESDGVATWTVYANKLT